VAHVTALGIHIKVVSIEASREFYENYLGLVPTFAYGNAEFLATVPDSATKVDEIYQGVTYEISPSTKLELADGHIAVKDQSVFAGRITSPKVSAMISVESLIPLLEGSDRRPNSSAKHYYWGTVEMVVRDPDGWVIVLIAPYSEEEVEGVSKYVAVERIDASQASEA
jgi:catechol 2,3-dioxygenase-like lactoylglutathione lyase family enzyme